MVTEVIGICQGFVLFFLKNLFFRLFVSRLTSEVVRSEEAKRYRPSPFIARGKDKIPESIFPASRHSQAIHLFDCAKPSDFVALSSPLRLVIAPFSNHHLAGIPTALTCHLIGF